MNLTIYELRWKSKVIYQIYSHIPVLKSCAATNVGSALPVVFLPQR